jgi:stage III sporulation protein AG
MFEKSQRETDPAKAGKLRLLVILGGAILGIILLLFAGGNSFSSDRSDETKETANEEETLRAYQNYLESRVKSICESVAGVGGVTVVVTLDGDFEEIYAKELKDGNEEYVIVGSGSNASALHLSRLTPKIAGIGVVCHGGANADIRQELTSLLAAAFDVPTNRIYITQAKG